jgi:methylphosphotriester-DNA--protein-cysteine methyltransferase
VTDYLQPEWSNVRFFCGTAPQAEIGPHRIDGARFVGTGPSALPCRFTLGPVRMWGVGFLPLGWARFFDADASDCANLICDGAQHSAFSHFAGLTEVLCDPEATLDEQFAALVAAMSRAMRPNRDEPRIARVHAALVSGEHATVHDLADACAMSIRTLERVCMRYFGFSPKLLMRRQRFMRSLTTFMLHRGSRWTEAMDAHYHDQAQFTREFREFMTMNPSDLVHGSTRAHLGKPCADARSARATLIAAAAAGPLALCNAGDFRLAGRCEIPRDKTQGHDRHHFSDRGRAGRHCRRR